MALAPFTLPTQVNFYRTHHWAFDRCRLFSYD